MKRRWRASTAALGRRMHDLELMTDYSYTQFNKELSRRGRRNEPAPLRRETSVALTKALTALTGEGLDIRAIARNLTLPVREVRALTFGLQALEGGHHAKDERRPALRLVPRP